MTPTGDSQPDPDGRPSTEGPGGPADAATFGTYLALDPNGAVLSLLGMLLDWVLEDDDAERLRQVRRYSALGQRGGRASETFDVEAFATKLFDPAGAILTSLGEVARRTEVAGPTPPRPEEPGPAVHQDPPRRGPQRRVATPGGRKSRQEHNNSRGRGYPH